MNQATERKNFSKIAVGKLVKFFFYFQTKETPGIAYPVQNVSFTTLEINLEYVSLKKRRKGLSAYADTGPILVTLGKSISRSKF